MKYQPVAAALQGVVCLDTLPSVVVACRELTQARDSSIVRRRTENHLGRQWECAFHGATSIFADPRSGALLVLEAGEEVLCVSRGGVVQRYIEGAWIENVLTLAQWVKEDAATPAMSGRCPFHAAIRRFFRFAEMRGLDTKADEEMRLAFSDFFGHTITTRRQLTGDEWYQAASAVRNYQLAW